VAKYPEPYDIFKLEPTELIEKTLLRDPHHADIVVRLCTRHDKEVRALLAAAVRPQVVR
jgi:hypothetical protein